MAGLSPMVDLHITNGDAAASLLEAGPIPGDVLPWRDPMHLGPFPAAVDLDRLAEVRAGYLGGPETAGREEALRAFRQRDQLLRRAPTYERVLLWFEHDLLDQLQLLQLLDWFHGADLGAARLEMICIDAFDGVEPFRGLGQLDAPRLASLFPRRVPVEPRQLSLASAGWAAFRASDPGELESFLASDLSALPFLHAALSRHLEEYPDATSGLTRTEAQIATLVARGISDPVDVFLANMDLETVLFMGDWPTYRRIGGLCGGDDPVLLCDSDEPFRFPPHDRLDPDAFRAQRLGISNTGRRILSGERDAFDTLRRDEWLGGVRVKSGVAMWTWNTEAERLERRR